MCCALREELTADGRYDVRLYDPLSEEWKVVTIDDRLPYWQRPGKHGTLCFAKPTKENEFWTCLLEKAVAKLLDLEKRVALCYGIHGVEQEWLFCAGLGGPCLNTGHEVQKKFSGLILCVSRRTVPEFIAAICLRLPSVAHRSWFM